MFEFCHCFSAIRRSGRHQSPECVRPIPGGVVFSLGRATWNATSIPSALNNAFLAIHTSRWTRKASQYSDFGACRSLRNWTIIVEQSLEKSALIESHQKRPTTRAALAVDEVACSVFVSHYGVQSTPTFFLFPQSIVGPSWRIPVSHSTAWYLTALSYARPAVEKVQVGIKVNEGEGGVGAACTLDTMTVGSSSACATIQSPMEAAEARKVQVY